MQSLSKTDTNAKQLFDIFLQSVQSSIVRTIARDSRFIVRSRKMEPFILLRAFVEVMGTDQEFSISSIYERYVQICIKEKQEFMKWEPFYDFLVKKEFVLFVDRLYEVVNTAALEQDFSEGANLVKVLKDRLSKLKGIVLQDGSEVATNSSSYKGKVTPQIKLHATLDLGSLAMKKSKITSGVKSERACINVSQLANYLLIADAGYPALKLFRSIEYYHGFYLIKLTTASTLAVTEAYKIEEDGTATKQEVIEKGKVHRYGDHVGSDKFKDGCTHDFKVATAKVKALDNISKYSFRVVKVYLPENAPAQELQGSGVDTYVERGKTVSKRFVLLATNIPADVADAEQIAQLYRARWSVEIGFRIHKGFCGLKKTLTKNKNLAKALVVMSQIVYTLKLLLAQGMERITGKVLSPKKTAHNGSIVLNEILSLLTHKQKCLKSIMQWSERFSCWTKSKPSYINRLKGKGLSCIIDVLRKPPIKLEGKSTGTSTSCVS